MAKHVITPDTEQASKYLDILFPYTDQYVFLAITDDKTAKKKRVLELTGTFKQHKKDLIRLNQEGLGVYVTVNKNDGKGRKKDTNIEAINTVFIEADDGLPDNYPSPSMLVETSPNKYHVYYLLDEPHEDLEAFTPVMARLVKDYKSDANAIDLSRVLRVPGFYHQKNTPRKVTMLPLVNSLPRYTWDEITDMFPPMPLEKPKERTFSAGEFNEIPKSTQVAAALSHIDPDCSYSHWLETLMALHYSYQGGEQGLKLAIEWSSGQLCTPPKQATQYKGENDIEWRWFTFNTDHSNPRTVGSIFEEAKQNGYVPTSTNEHSMKFINMESQDVLKKIFDTHAIARLMQGGTRLIRRNPEGEYIDEHPAESAQFLKHVKIPVEKKDKAGVPYIKPTPAFSIWENSEDRFAFEALVFRPKPNLFFDPKNDNMGIIKVDPKHPHILNTFYGTRGIPKEGDWTPIKELVLHGAAKGDQTVADWIHQYHAHLVQRPHKKTEVMVTYVGSRGTGKSTLAAIPKALMEPYTTRINTFDRITGRFNDSFEKVIIINLEEAIWAGNYDMDSILKDLITAKSGYVEGKGKKGNNNTRLYHNFIATSNPGFSVPEEAKGEERRYATLTFSDNYKNDRTFFASILEDPNSELADNFEGESEIKESVIMAYKHYLLNLDITEYDPRDIPNIDSEHASFNRMQKLGAPFQYLEDAIQNHEIVPSTKITSQIRTHFDDEEAISMNKMWNNLNDEEMYIKPSLIKKLVMEYQRLATKAYRSSSSDIYKYWIEKGIPIKPSEYPTKTLIAKYQHLKQQQRYTILPNRHQMIRLFTLRLGILPIEEYKDEL